MKKFLSIIITALCASGPSADAMVKLTGTPIASGPSIDYATGQPSTTVHTADALFDGDLDTYFATYARSYGWGGVDLGKPHVIERIGWAPRNDYWEGPARVKLAVIQGANSPDFLDAVPLYIIMDEAPMNKLSYANVNCSKGFRYIRYVGPSDKRCNLAELVLFGHEGEGTDSRMFQFTNRPTVVINTVDSREPFDKTTNIDGNVIILNNRTYDTNATATIRERGNSSRSHPKKPWRIKFEKKQHVLDSPAKAKKWTLINNHSDKTLMRNALAFEISRRIGLEYTPFCQIVDVVLNGEFKGCYQLCDQVEAKKGRIPVDEMEATDIELPELSGGYHFEIDSYANEEPQGTWFKSETDLEIPVTVKSPEDGGTPEQMSYIRDYFNQFINVAMGRKFSSADEGLETILDLDMYLRYFITQEIMANADGVWSCHMYKKRNDPLIYTGPIWDAELAFDNDSRVYPASLMSTFCTVSGRGAVLQGFLTLHKRIFRAYPGVSKRFSRIWSIARNEQDLTAESLCDYIDETAADIEQSANLNFKRWDVLGKHIFSNPRAEASFEEAVDNLKTYIRTRFDWLDEPARFNYDPEASSISAPSVETPLSEDIRVIAQTVSISGDEEFSVFTPAGSLCFRGTGRSPRLAPGIYIVNCGTRTAKLTIF